MRTIMAGLAEFKRDLIRERVKVEPGRTLDDLHGWKVSVVVQTVS